MSINDFGVDGSGRDWAYVWFEPGKIKAADLSHTLSQAGLERLMPKKEAAENALRETLGIFIDASRIKVRGNPITLNPLRSDVRGFEAVRQQRGKTRNEHEFLISLVEDQGSVTIGGYIIDIFPRLAGNIAATQAKLTEVYGNKLTWCPTHVATAVLSRCVEAVQGTACRKAGGVYAIPEGGIDTFEGLAHGIGLAEGELEVVVTKFPVIPGDRAHRLILESIRKEAGDTAAEIESQITGMEGKQRENGMLTRLRSLDEVEAKLTQYEELLGVTLEDMKEAVVRVRNAVSAKAALDLRS